MAQRRLGGCDQSLKGANLIGKATLNFLQAGGCRKIIAVEEKRLHLRHEHVGFAQEVACLRSGDCIQGLNPSDRHASSVLLRKVRKEVINPQAADSTYTNAPVSIARLGESAAAPGAALIARGLPNSKLITI